MKILSILIVLFSFNTFAKDYRGFGKFITNNSQINCSEVFFSYDQTPTELKINSGHYICDNGNGVYSPRTFEIRNGILFENNLEMGSIDSNKILIKDLNRPEYEMFIKKFQEKTFVVESVVQGQDLEILVGVLTDE